MRTLDLCGDGQAPFADFVWELDLTCPHCKGEGYDEYCEHCTEGRFEIMWNTAYGVRVPYGANFEEMHLLAWDLGFCLVEHEGNHWLLMGSCGLDMTWRIHYTRWAIQGWLGREDIDSCLGSGGHVFLQAPERCELCNYFLVTLPTPEDYAASYAYTTIKIKEIRGEEEST